MDSDLDVARFKSPA